MKTNFEALKNVLTEKARLYLPKPGLPWRIITDASNSAVCGVLEQQQEDGNRHPVAFYSRKLQGLPRLQESRKHMPLCVAC